MHMLFCVNMLYGCRLCAVLSCEIFVFHAVRVILLPRLYDMSVIVRILTSFVVNAYFTYGFVHFSDILGSISLEDLFHYIHKLANAQY